MSRASLEQTMALLTAAPRALNLRFERSAETFDAGEIEACLLDVDGTLLPFGGNQVTFTLKGSHLKASHLGRP